MVNKYSLDDPGSLFWDAIRFNAGSMRDEDLADVAAYVVSRGEGAINSFLLAREEATKRFVDAGGLQALRRHADTPDGRSCSGIDDDTLLGFVDSLLLWGHHLFHRVLADVSFVSNEFVYPVDLKVAIETAQGDPRVAGGPLWEMKRGDLRKYEEPWLILDVGSEVDVPESFAPLDQIEAFIRFHKSALFASRSDEWRAVRDAVGARTIDVLLEYQPSNGEEFVKVLSRGRRTEVLVFRPYDRGEANLEAITLGQAEASEVLGLAYAALVGNA